MTIKTLNAMKSMGILSLLLLFITSCSYDESNSIDAKFIDNLNFVTTEIISEVQFSNENIESVESQSGGQFLLGVYDEPAISKIRGSFVSQLVLPSDIYSMGELNDPNTVVTSTIDDVVLYLPYQATVTSVDTSVDSITVYTYELDSIFGIKNAVNTNSEPYGSFSFEVYELETFLNPFDITDPSSSSVYYSNKDYEEKTLLGTMNDYSPTASDIGTTVNRTAGGKLYMSETIELTNNTPRIAVHLNKDFFQTEFLDKLPTIDEEDPSEFQSSQSFIRYFKGLYVKTISGDAASIVPLLLTNATVEMYYTNLLSNSDSIYRDTIARTMSFSLGGVQAVKYESFDAVSQDSDKLYIQGASGSQANIKLLGYDEDNPIVVSDELESLRKMANDTINGKPLWLINEANLFFYVDEGFTPTDEVYKLFLYKKVPEIGSVLAYNSQLLDYLTASLISGVEGDLLKDDNDAYYYKFRLTDYITNLLKFTDSIENPDGSFKYINTKNVDNLGLKVYNSIDDYPVSDTLVGTSNWNPRGTVLYGGNQLETEEKRTLLKINYSYQNR